MQVRIIIDNDTLDDNLVPEAGFSAFITENNKRILFDTGREGNVIGNAEKLGIDLLKLDYVVLSHGHHDHTNGIENLVDLYNKHHLSKDNRPVLIAHPDAFYPRYNEAQRFIGSKLNKEETEANFNIVYSSKPMEISDRLLFLGEIPKNNEFEGKKPLGKMHRGAQVEDDYIPDDTALVYKSNKGLVIISGCSHSGICNILDYALKVTGEDKIDTVIGGFHLKNEAIEFINKTAEELAKYDIKNLHACHCTGNTAKETLKKTLPQTNIGCSFLGKYERS